MQFLEFSNQLCVFILGIVKDRLDAYLKKHLPIASVLRLPERQGLIRARLEGARKATADVLIFLDSHTECTTNWLPPLLGQSD